MAYKKISDRYGRQETITDVQGFAAALSKALGGEALLPEREAIDRENFASFRLGTDILHVTGNRYGDKGRVSIRISAPDVKHDDVNSYDKNHRTDEAPVDPDARPIARIAADVRKRVIDASQEALSAQRAYAQEKNASRVGIVQHMETLKAALPGLRVARQNDRDLSANVHGGASMPYVSATLSASGTLSIHHITSMTVDQFVRVMRALEGEG